ncbi:MAG: caspase family protein [Anaerolineae bacterium]|nr:caspase family protein [Anaerolineae bacterium]
MKFDRALGITVQTGGELLAQGTRAQPVYFTSVKDDTLGGDSNLDGALTSPTPGDWRGILSTGGQVTLDHAILHYGGGTTNGIWSSTAAAVATTNSGTLRVGNSMIRDPYFEGVIAWGSGDVTITNTVIAGADRGVNSDGSAVVRLTNCTLDDNRVGLYGHGGNLLVTNAIIANSLAYGIDNVLSSPITLRYSDVWSGQGTDYYHMADQTGTNGNLSVDPVFKNRATGIFLLQYVSPMIDAADGVEAPSSDALGSQRYDDPRTPNTGVPTGTGAYADIGAYEFVETAESPVDLVVASIDAPSTLVAGEWITVTWTIRNDGTEPATGPWHDVIALVQSPDSRPTTVEVAEVLIGEGISLAPGHPYVASAHVRVPGAQVGEQFWQVTGNSRAEIFEGRNITNNVTLAEYPATLSFEALVIDGGATTGAFTDQEQRHWFRFTPQAGQNVRVSLDLASTVGTTELYLGVGYIPSPDGYDVRSPEWQMPDSHLSVAEAVSTTYYMLAYGTAPGTFEIRAASYAFSLDSVSPSTGGNAGQVTLLINGEAIPLSPTVTLVHTTAGDIAALATHRVGADCVAATFDLNGVAPGVADVRVSSGSTTRSLSQAFSVVAGGAPDFWWSVDGPDLVRSGRLNEYTVTWGNQGAIDAPVHLMALSTSSLITMTLLIPETGEVLDNGFQFLAMTPNAAVPSIPPGATGSFRFAAVSDGFGGFTLEARAIGLDDPALASAPIDWDDFRDYTKPDELTDEQWDAVFDALIADLGANWADVGSVLASDGLASFLEPDSPLFPRSDGVGLRIPLLRALDRGAADLGWTDDQDVTAHRLMELATERPGRLLSLSVTISGYEKAPQTDDLAGVRVDRENIRNYLTNTAQALPGNQTALDQPIGSDGALMRADIRAEVQRLAGAATDQDTLFFYFSGHGTIADLNSSGAFVDALGVGYEYDEFVTDIRNTQAKNVVVIVDACHSESLINAVKFDLTDPLKDRLTIIASSAVHQTSGLDDDEGSYLSTELAGRLRGYNGNRLVSLKEAFDEIPRDLDPDPAVQTPRWYGPDITLHDPTTQSKEGIVRNLSQRAPVLGGVRSLRGVSGGGADPNDKTGGGYGTVGWVQAGQQLFYTIHFENIPPAGVPPELVWPVQEIVVTDQLSPDLDWSTFALGTLGFNNTVVAVPPGRMTYEGITRVSTDPNPVMITATLNTQTGLITWRMHAYEDLTGQLPEDPLAGFLPANDETHTGEGYVTFSIRPKAELAQGSAFTNRADIIFDVNAPIVTNVVTNTLDTARPSSTVASLPATVSDPAFSVSWSGSDLGGSGVDLYDIYVSDDGTPFTLWQSAITTTQAVFAGASGHTYGFYSVATDHVGHRETAPTTAQATTTVQTGTYVYLPLVIRNF